ncbi:MAG: hypothetical protein K0S41_3343 [Anaerocolumna sp.]|nr:hypothetical protein [Anaerocolumna sp.]
MMLSKIRFIFIILIIMIFIAACQTQKSSDTLEKEIELTSESEFIIENNEDTVETIPAFDVNSVLYENAIQNDEPVIDIFYNENIYAFYGDKIKIFDFTTKAEMQTIHLEGLEDVNVPVVVSELNPISDEPDVTENKSKTYVTTFTIYKNEYYVISNTTENTKNITKILRFDSNGRFINEYPIQIDNLAEKIEIQNDMAVILSINVDSIQEPLPYYDLTVFNLLEQKQSKVDLNKVQAVTMNYNNKATIATIEEDNQNSNLQIIDLKTLQIEKEANVDMKYIMDLSFYDNKLYILTLSDVFNIDIDLATSTTSLLNNYVKGTHNRRLKIYKDAFVIMHSSNNILLYDFNVLERKEVDSKPYTLTFLTPYDTNSSNYIFRDYINDLKKKYPNINLVTLDLINTNEIHLDEYNEKVAKKLMANDTDFDLYFAYDNDNLIKSDYYVDLSQYKQIDQNLDNMLPGIKNLMSYNNKLFGVPINITFRGLSYHAEELNSLELQFPSGTWTISDFNDFAVKNKDIIEREQKPLLNVPHVLTIDSMFNNSFYVSYLQGAELSSEDLAFQFERLKNMVEENLIRIDPNFKGDAIIFERNFNSLSEAEPHLAPVVANENCKYLASIDYVALNPSSPNKELAAELLATFTDSEIRKKSIFQEIGMQIQYNSSQLDSIEIPNIFNIYNELDRFDSFTLYKELLKQSYRNINYEGAAEFGYLFEEYMNGKRTAKSAADEIIQRLNMMKYE